MPGWRGNALPATLQAAIQPNKNEIFVSSRGFQHLAVWLALHDLDEKHAVDASLTAGFWYWTAAAGAVVYVVIYLVPRML